MTSFSHFIPRRWQYLPVILIVLLAFALRAGVVYERAAAGDDRFYPPFLSDGEAYFRFAGDFLDGTFPFRPYDFQPGVIYAWAGLIAVVGESVPMLRLALSLVDAVGCGFLIGCGWLLTNRVWGGYLAGLLMAIYPVSVFYGTAMLLEGFAAFLYVLWFFLMLWQRRELAFWRTLLIGILTGYLFVTRSHLAVTAAIWLFWLILQRPIWQLFAKHAALLALGTALTIAPFTLWNMYSGEGKFQLLLGDQWGFLYSGNNRDGDGTGGTSMAYHALDVEPREAVFRDIWVDPARFVGLMLRKGAIAWSEAEPGNNEDFFITRTYSPTLSNLPRIGFPLVAFFALIGVTLLFYADRRLAYFFLLLLAYLTVSIMISFALSRLRYPTMIPLFILAAYGITRLVELFQQRAWQTAKMGQLVRRYALPTILIALMVWFPMWALTGSPPPVPPKRHYTALPNDAVPLNAVFDDTLLLVGWRYAPFTRWWDAAEKGWIVPEKAYTIELFWQVTQPTEDDYHFYLACIDGDMRVCGVDSAIGSVSHPPKNTHQWQVGDIYGEIVSVKMPMDIPLAKSFEMRIGVYRKESRDAAETIVNVPVTQPPGLSTITLQTMAAYQPANLPPPPENIPENMLVFGDDTTGKMALRGVAFPAEAATGETILVQFWWEAQTEIQRNANLFLHGVDANHQLLTQGDSMVKPGLFTMNWLPGYPIISEVPLPMPNQPGTYALYAGLIDAYTTERWSVDAPDFRPLLGEIVVQ